jgi:quercetin dioxygenase-like cupin family protein
MNAEFKRATTDEWNSLVVPTASVPIVDLMPGVQTHIVPGGDMTLSFASLDANTFAPIHSHSHEQMIVVLKGEVDSIVDGKAYHVQPGDVVPIPGGVPHGARTFGEPAELLEIFTPARKEFEEKLRLAIAARGEQAELQD